MDDNVKKLWDALSPEIQLPEYDKFKEFMATPENRKLFHSKIVNDYKVPQDFAAFDSWLIGSAPEVSKFPKLETATPESTDTPVQQLRAEPVQRPLIQQAIGGLAAGIESAPGAVVDILRSNIDPVFKSSPEGMAIGASVVDRAKAIADLIPGVDVEYSPWERSIAEKIASGSQEFTDAERNYLGTGLIADITGTAGVTRLTTKALAALAKKAPKIASLATRINEGMLGPVGSEIANTASRGALGGAIYDVATTPGTLGERGTVAAVGAGLGGVVNLGVGAKGIAQKISKTRLTVDLMKSGADRQTASTIASGMVEKYNGNVPTDLIAAQKMQLEGKISQDEVSRVEQEISGAQNAIEKGKIEQGGIIKREEVDVGRVPPEAGRGDQFAESQEIQPKEAQEIGEPSPIGKRSEPLGKEVQQAEEPLKPVRGSFFDRLARKIGDVYFQNRTWRVKGLQEEINRSRQEQESARFEVTNIIRDIDSKLSKYDKSVRGSYKNDVNEFLVGNKKIEDLPEDVRADAKKARDWHDELEKQLRVEEVLREKNAPGPDPKYLRRSYRVFFDSEWEKKALANTRLVTNAKQAIREGFERDGIKYDEAMVEARLRKLVDRETMTDVFYSGGTESGMNIQSLTRRKDIDPRIREFMGEIKDPYVNIMETAKRQANMLANARLQKRMRKLLIDNGLASEKEGGAHYQRLVGKESLSNKFLRGLYADPVIAEAIEKVTKGGSDTLFENNLMRSIAFITGLAKYSKTVLNPISYAPQFIGNYVINAAAGHTPLIGWGRGAKTVLESLAPDSALRKVLGEPKLKELRALVQHYISLGLINKDINARDFYESVRGVPLMEKMVGNKAFNAAIKSNEKILSLFSAADNISRIRAFESDLKVYRKAYPDMPLDQLERMVADKVNDYMINYDTTPGSLKKASVVGITQSFVNFTYQVFRSSYKIAELAIQEMKSDNPVLQRKGKLRIASLITVIGATYGIYEMAKARHGVSDEQEKAVKFFEPPWVKNNMLLFTEFNNDGKYKYLDMSYLFPHEMLVRGMVSAVKQESIPDAVNTFQQAYTDQFFDLGKGVIAGRLVGAMTGYQEGKPVDAPGSETMYEKAVDRAKFVAEGMMPQAFRFGTEVSRAIEGTPGAYGKQYTLQGQAYRLAGARENNRDVRQAVPFRLSDIKADVNKAIQFYNEKNPDKNSASRKEAMEKGLQKAENDLYLVYKYATVLGVPANQVRAEMAKSFGAFGSTREKMILSRVNQRILSNRKGQ